MSKNCKSYLRFRQNNATIKLYIKVNKKEVMIMEKLNKILLLIVLIVAIALISVTFMYFDMRKTAKDNQKEALEMSESLYKISLIPNTERLIAEIKAIENPEERAMLIEVYLQNGNLTEDVAKMLY